ncbi:MAG: hypothetical protein WC228_06485, partial [Candidatus Cloacimonadaceae bacterium]
TGNKMSWTNGAWPMSYAPAHHFGSCLKKLKKQSAILGYYRGKRLAPQGTGDREQQSVRGNVFSSILYSFPLDMVAIWLPLPANRWVSQRHRKRI